ncbi:MAG: alpha/beta hydrolase fold domain-containing protein [Armatimonadota bacterium]
MNRRSFLPLLFTAPLLLTACAAHGAPMVNNDVQYGEAGGERLLLDVYQPEGEGPHPAVMIVHGGGWAGGNKRGHQHTGNLLASHGYVAFSVGYRFAPKHPFPAAVDDVQRAVRWVRAHAKEYRIDPERIGALGDSAGGHLVSMLGASDTRDNSVPELSRYSSRVRAVVNYYGPTELERMWKTELVRDLLRNFLGGPPEEKRDNYRAASPYEKLDRRTAPHLIFHGTADQIVPEEQAHLLHEKLRKNDVESTLVIFEGAGHGWSPTSSEGQRAEREILAFFARHLKKEM